MPIKVNLKSKNDEELKQLQDQLKLELAQRDEDSLRKRIREHMNSVEGMQAEISMLQGEIDRIEAKRHQRHESRKHLDIMHRPLDASAHTHEGDTIRRNRLRIAELEAKINGARPIEVDLLHWEPTYDKNKKILGVLEDLKERVMRHNMWDNVEKAIKYHCFHDGQAWDFLEEFCSLALSVLNQKDARFTRGGDDGYDGKPRDIPEYIKTGYGENCSSCGSDWVQTCRGECTKCGHKNGWPEHYDADEAKKRKKAKA